MEPHRLKQSGQAAPEPGRAAEPALAALADTAALAPDAPFAFACLGCGDCCRARRDLLLSGYDLYRIARWLRLPPRLAASAFCRVGVGPATCLPALRLAPRGKNADCPFLDGGACAIHPARPLACALYPLGQSIDTATGRAVYYAQPPLCGQRAPGRTLRQYLADAGVEERYGIDVQWAKACTALSEKLLAAGGQSHPRFGMAYHRAVRALYYDYSLRDDFYPQFRENLDALWPLLERILAR